MLSMSTDEDDSQSLSSPLSPSSLSSSFPISRSQSHEPLRKDDVTKHFPPDFDCSQLLFSNEQIAWVQHVPRFKRYVPIQLAKVMFRLSVVLGFSILLFSIGCNLESANIEKIIRSVRSEYLTSGVIFFALFWYMIYKDFGGFAVDIATNVRMLRVYIYPTIVCCETVSYKSIEKITTTPNYIRFTLRVLSLKNSTGIIASIKRVLSTPKFYFSYIPTDNTTIKDLIKPLVSDALAEASALERSENALQKLEDNTPSNPEVFEKYRQHAGETEDDIVWGYTPSTFEKRRSTAIHLSMIGLYYAIVTIGLVLPIVSVLLSYAYSKGAGYMVLIIWHIYFIAIILMDTEFSEIITLNSSSISSITTRLTCIMGKCPRFVQCGSRVSKLSYACAYPLYSYLYRTPNSTPTEYIKLRKLQGLEARILGYTDGSGAIQFPNNLTLRVPNLLDVESAILQKHYQMWKEAQASLPNRAGNLQSSPNVHQSSAVLQPLPVEEDAFQIDDSV